MRSLHPDLSAAQKASKRRPHLRVVVKDTLAGVNRHRRTQWYAGEEPDSGHAAVVAADGSLIRCRFTDSTLYRSRVTNPTSESTYSSWQSLGTAKANIVALAKAGSTLWMFFVHPANQSWVYAQTSTDNGESWSASASQFNAGATVTLLAAAGKSNGDVVVILDRAGFYAFRKPNGQAWQAGVLGDLDLPASHTGIAVFHSGDWNVIVTGQASTLAYVVATALFGDGYSQAAQTWSSRLDILTAHPDSNIAFSCPYAARPDTNRMTFRQQHTGTVAYDRNHHTQQPATVDFVNDRWREPVPYDLDVNYGLAISYDSTNVFYTTARHVYHTPAAPASLDLSADVAAAHLFDEPLSPRLSQIVLDNPSGNYNTPGSGAVATLTKGTDVEISYGYHTASGVRYSQGPTYHVQTFEHTYEKGRATLRIILGSPWTHLARHRFPRAVALAEADKNVFNQLAYVLARVGYEFSSTGGSSESANLYPPLVIQPGTSALTALRAILARVPDHLFTRAEFLFINEPLAADSADATYSRPLAAADQAIAAATYRDSLKDASHIQVIAEEDASIVAEALDTDEIDLLYAAPLQRADPFLDTGAEATDRAAREQRQQTIHTTRGDRITAPVHCGLETNDIIALTDDRHGLTDAKRRVLALETHYQRGPQKARYDHIIELGAP